MQNILLLKLGNRTWEQIIYSELFAKFVEVAMTTQTKRSRSQPLRGHSIDYSVRAHIAAAVNHDADTALTTQYTYTQCRCSQPLRGHIIDYVDIGGKLLMTSHGL